MMIDCIMFGSSRRIGATMIPDTAAASQDERGRKGGPVTHAAADQSVSNGRREDGHLALGEVDEAHRVVDEDESQREAREDAADRNTADDLLEKRLHQ